jgi:hypothetical protein
MGSTDAIIYEIFMQAKNIPANQHIISNVVPS